MVLRVFNGAILVALMDSKEGMVTNGVIRQFITDNNLLPESILKDLAEMPSDLGAIEYVLVNYREALHQKKNIWHRQYVPKGSLMAINCWRRQTADKNKAASSGTTTIVKDVKVPAGDIKVESTEEIS